MPFYNPATSVNFQKCGVIGTDALGSAVAYALLKTGWFSELVLLDPDPSKAKLQAIDLSHALPFHLPMAVYAGSYTDLSDAGIIVIAAGASPSPDQADNELAKINAPLIRTIANNVAIYNQNAILLMASTPTDMLTDMLYRSSGYPASRVMGLGTLPDTARLKQLLGKELEVDSRQVHALIIGAHGEHELAVWSSANISGIDLPHFCQYRHSGYDPSHLDQLFQQIKSTARQIVCSPNAAGYAVAESVKRITSAILRNENTILPLSVHAFNCYDLPDTFLSLPCIVNRLGISQILEIPLNQDELQQLHRSAERSRALPTPT